MSIIIAAPSSGSGKTTITLGILRALYKRGLDIRGLKSGPDYIDPQFHSAACGKPCFNLDAWAMPDSQIKELSARSKYSLIEGAMGLFDGAPPEGKGSTADLATQLGLPVVLVVDVASMAQSIAPLVQGFSTFDPDVKIAGIILNKVGSARHERMLRNALADTGVRVIGAVRRSPNLKRPSRHLGLVQAGEMPDLMAFLDLAASQIENAIDLDFLVELMSPNGPQKTTSTTPQRRIAIARDAAFSFVYAHQILDWESRGYDIETFSPLANEPVPQADEVFLPGGYPELYAAQLAGNQTFFNSLRSAAETTKIKGECGGYMVLGETLTDADGEHHRMAGLLSLHTSFAERKLHLGYRQLTEISTGKSFKGHEFHYAGTISAEGTPLYSAQDAEGVELGNIGLVDGNVSGSFAHLIC